MLYDINFRGKNFRGRKGKSISTTPLDYMYEVIHQEKLTKIFNSNECILLNVVINYWILIFQFRNEVTQQEKLTRIQWN